MKTNTNQSTNIFNLTPEEEALNMKRTAIRKYGKDAFTKRVCEVCKVEYLPIQSNASYSASFCSAHCQKKRGF